MSHTLFQAPRAAFAANVDATSGVIRRVSVITVGPALGHGMMIDATTLQQVKACAEQYSGGLKVKLNHSGGVDAIIGYLSAFAIEGNKLVADLHLLENSPQRQYVLELATKIPDTIGLSIAFSGVAQKIGDVYFARCSEIYSADLVSEPAANPEGLFSRRFDAWQKDKGTNAPISAHHPQSTTKNMDNEILSQIGKMIDDKLAAATAAFDAKLAEFKKADETACARIEEVAKLSGESADKAALAAVKEFAKTLGAPAGNAAAPSAPATPQATKKFEQLIKDHPDYAKSKSAALHAVIKSNPTEYSDYRNRCQSGEIILF